MESNNSQVEESRKQMIEFFVNELGATSIAEVDGPNESLLRFWNYNGHLIISQFWPAGGWDCFYQSRQGNVDEMKKEVQRWDEGY